MTIVSRDLRTSLKRPILTYDLQIFNVKASILSSPLRLTY